MRFYNRTVSIQLSLKIFLSSKYIVDEICVSIDAVGNLPVLSICIDIGIYYYMNGNGTLAFRINIFFYFQKHTLPSHKSPQTSISFAYIQYCDVVMLVQMGGGRLRGHFRKRGKHYIYALIIALYTRIEFKFNYTCFGVRHDQLTGAVVAIHRSIKGLANTYYLQL